LKKALVTGVTGQDGAYLAKLLLEKGYRVFGAYRRVSLDVLYRLRFLGIDDQVELIEFDLTEVNGVNRTLQRLQPDEVYNLAAQSFVGSSWQHPIVTADINAMGVARLLDAVRSYCPEARFYQASTSEMFGKVRAVPQTEDTPFHPRSPYGVAKAFSHYLTVNYRESFGLHASSGILFNHESPIRGVEFVTRKISSGLARLALQGGESLRLGNMDAKRDWGFAGDYVEGMWQMLQQPTGDDYVLATGVATSIRVFAEYVGAAVGMDIVWKGEGLSEKGIDRKTGRVVIEIDEKFHRPAEVNFLLGDASKAQKKLGWRPATPVTMLAVMMARADFDALS